MGKKRTTLISFSHEKEHIFIRRIIYLYVFYYSWYSGVRNQGVCSLVGTGLLKELLMQEGYTTFRWRIVISRKFQDTALTAVLFKRI